jgi:hypothetical protein
MLTLAVATVAPAAVQKIAAPRVWNDKDLATWAAPVAGLNVRPGHFSEREYDAAPEAKWVRTWPVYFPGRQPACYNKSLDNEKAEPLIARAQGPGKSGSKQDRSYSASSTSRRFAATTRS